MSIAILISVTGPVALVVTSSITHYVLPPPSAKTSADLDSFPGGVIHTFIPSGNISYILCNPTLMRL